MCFRLLAFRGPPKHLGTENGFTDGSNQLLVFQPDFNFFKTSTARPPTNCGDFIEWTPDFGSNWWVILLEGGPSSVCHYWLFGLSNQSRMTGSLQSDSSHVVAGAVLVVV